MRTSNEEDRRNGSQAARLFVAYLNDLPLVAWVRTARQRPFVPGMAEAEMALDAIVRQHDQPSAVFATRQGVLDALLRFSSVEGRQLTRRRYAIEHLRPATEHAALAVLCRQRLSADQFVTLYAPFEPVIPTELLFGLPE